MESKDRVTHCELIHEFLILIDKGDSYELKIFFPLAVLQNSL